MLTRHTHTMHCIVECPPLKQNKTLKIGLVFNAKTSSSYFSLSLFGKTANIRLSKWREGAVLCISV